MPDETPPCDVSKLDLTYLTAAASNLDLTLTQLLEGDILPDEERRRHGAALFIDLFMAVMRCSLALDQLGIGSLSHCKGGLSVIQRFNAVQRLYRAVSELKDALRPLPPDAKAAYPHLNLNSDWGRKLPAISVLAARQAAAMLRELCPAPLIEQGADHAPRLWVACGTENERLAREVDCEKTSEQPQPKNLKEPKAIRTKVERDTLARLVDLAPIFDAGRGTHSNVWLTVAAGDRESYPPPVHLFMRAHSSVWRRWESRPPPNVSDAEHGARRPVLLRRREGPAAPPPPGEPPARLLNCDETAHLFGAIADIEAFIAAAESAGGLLDPTAECPSVSPLVTGAACDSAPLARWIGQVYATLSEHRPSLIVQTPATPDGIELYVLDLDPWEASVLTIRLLQTQAAAELLNDKDAPTATDGPGGSAEIAGGKARAQQIDLQIDAPHLQTLWLSDDLRTVAGAAGEAIAAGIALLRFAAKPDETPEADRAVCERARRVLNAAQKTRDLARPLTKELVEAHNRSGSKLPTICGVTDAFAVGLAASFAYATLDAYSLPFETDDSWGSSFYAEPPADPSIMPEIRKRLRGLAIPDGKALCELIDKEVRTAATIRLGVGKAKAPSACTEPQPHQDEGETPGDQEAGGAVLEERQAIAVPPPAMLSAADLARHLDQPPARVESFLRRYRENYPDCYVTVDGDDRRRNQARYLYRTADVLAPLREHLARRGG